MDNGKEMFMNEVESFLLDVKIETWQKEKNALKKVLDRIVKQAVGGLVLAAAGAGLSCFGVTATLHGNLNFWLALAGVASICAGGAAIIHADVKKKNLLKSIHKISKKMWKLEDERDELKIRPYLEEILEIAKPNYTSLQKALNAADSDLEEEIMPEEKIVQKILQIKQTSPVYDVLCKFFAKHYKNDYETGKKVEEAMEEFKEISEWVPDSDDQVAAGYLVRSYEYQLEKNAVFSGHQRIEFVRAMDLAVTENAKGNTNVNDIKRKFIELDRVDKNGSDLLGKNFVDDAIAMVLNNLGKNIPQNR